MSEENPYAGPPPPNPADPPPGWPQGYYPAPPPGRRSPRGLFIAGGVLGIIASANLLLMTAVLQILVKTEGLLGIIFVVSVTGIVLAALSCGGRRWAAVSSAGVQLVALLAVLALPFGGYQALAVIAAPRFLPLDGGGGAAAGLLALLLLGMLGLIQVALSLLSAVFSLVAYGRREG